MVYLYNVIDLRNMQYYSVAIVKAKNAKWFIPANPEEGEDNG